MDAFCFTLAVFGFWVLLGRAVLSLCPTGLPPLQQWLLSPTIGVSALLLPVFWLNRAGLPVKDFGVWLVVGLAALSGVIVWCKRPETPRKELLIVGLILFGALLFAAWPMFRFGFAWLSFCNDDMANYCLAADRFLNHGFFDGPNMKNFLEGRDYTQAYWFMHVAGNVRSGSDLILATACAFLGPKSAHQVFMPVIAALHVALVSSSGALALATPGSKKRAFWTMALVGISSLTVLGFFYQLIAQVGGLAILVAAVCMTFRESAAISKKKYTSILAQIPGALVILALTIDYPELIPFLILGFLVFIVLQAIKNRTLSVQRILYPSFITGIFIIVIGNVHLLNALGFLSKQAARGKSPSALELTAFPYFLIPTGLPTFWGLRELTGSTNEPVTSILIVLAVTAFSVLVFVFIPSLFRAPSASACILFSQFAVSALLFYRNSDFGLFKMAMFAQPFLWCCCVESYGILSKLQKPLSVFAFCFLLLNVKSSLSYSLGSNGDLTNVNFSEIKGASKNKITEKIRSYFSSPDVLSSDGLLIDVTSNVVLAKIIALYSKGKRTLWTTTDFFDQIENSSDKKNDLEIMGAEAYRKTYTLKNGNKVVQQDQKSNSNSNQYINLGQEAINYDDKNNYIGDHSANFFFINSAFGYHYYLANILNKRDKIAIYKDEKDPFFFNKDFYAIGNHLLFSGVATEDFVRIILDITTTPLVAAGASQFPIILINEKNVQISGNGAARIITDLISFEKKDNGKFISVDINQPGMRFSDYRPGLQSLYGRKVPSDFRQISVFCRNISMITEAEYAMISPPSHLAQFPEDLQNTNLQFSGIYEDGWISQAGMFKLKPNNIGRILKISGFIPQIDNAGFKSLLTVKCEGMEIFQKELHVGDFLVESPVRSSKTQTIELTFGNTQILPNGDGRAIGGKIKFIGFTE